MKRNILIVDDNRLHRKALISGLKVDGYGFHQASSVKEGLEVLTEHDDIQVVILDLDLQAGGQGHDFLKQIKNGPRTPKVIVLTGHEELLHAPTARQLGVFNYQTKGEEKIPVHSIRFAVEQAYQALEFDLLKTKFKRLKDIQEKINSNHKLDEILHSICASVLELVSGYTCHFRLFNLRTGDFDLVAFKGPSPSIESYFDKTKPLGKYYSGKAASEKHPIIIPDLQKDPPFLKMKDKYLKMKRVNKEVKKYLDTVRSAYIVPISTGIFDTEVDAVLNISSEVGSFFKNEEIRNLIEEFVAHAVLAITKEWQKLKRDELHKDYSGISEMLAEVSRQLHGGDVQDKILDVVGKRIARIVNPEMISIFLLNRKTSFLENIAEFKGEERVKINEFYPPGKSLTGWVYKENKPLRLPNLEDHIYTLPETDERFDKQLGEELLANIPSKMVKHYLGVPMNIGRNKVGVIRVVNKKSDNYKLENTGNNLNSLLPRGFSEDCETVLKITASHLAVSIRNAELIKKLKWKIDQLQTLTEVARAIGSNSGIEIDELLEIIVTKTAEVMNAEICMLFLKEELENKIVLKQAYPGDMYISKDAFYKLGEGKTGKVALKGEPLLEPRTDDNYKGKYDDQIIKYLLRKKNQQAGGRKGGKKKPIESFMAVPIITDDRSTLKGKSIIGVLKVINKTTHLPFDKDDLSIFTTFASQIGVALAIAKRNVELSHFVGGVCHEVNNTSGLVPTHIKEIKKRLAHFEDNNYKKEMIKSLEIINNTAFQAVDFSKDLLGFGRIKGKAEGERKADLDINQLVREAVRQLSVEPKSLQSFANVVLEDRLLKKPLICNVHKTPFIHVVRNIIANAYQAMEGPKKGKLIIKSYEDASGKIAYIRFTDNGPGIKKKDIVDIFKPDFSTREGGNGLGLWMCRTYLNRMNGNISVESTFRHGAAFTIQLPTIHR